MLDLAALATSLVTSFLVPLFKKSADGVASDLQQRAGDAIAEHEGEIRYGMRIDSDPAEQAKIFKLFGVQERLDSQWLYRENARFPGGHPH